MSQDAGWRQSEHWDVTFANVVTACQNWFWRFMNLWPWLLTFWRRTLTDSCYGQDRVLCQVWQHH